MRTSFSAKIKSAFFTRVSQGCQIYLVTTYQNGKNVPNNHKIYQISAIFIPNGNKIDQISQNTTNGNRIDPNGNKLCQPLPLQELLKFTQFGILGLKIRHLATLHVTPET
jgi:hypothetical protein